MLLCNRAITDSLCMATSSIDGRDTGDHKLRVLEHKRNARDGI